MSYTTISIREARNNLAELVEQVAVAKRGYLITKFGKPKAVILPIGGEERKTRLKERVLQETAGMWVSRRGMTDAAGWVAKLREKESSRYGKVFS